MKLHCDHDSPSKEENVASNAEAPLSRSEDLLFSGLAKYYNRGKRLVFGKETRIYGGILAESDERGGIYFASKTGANRISISR